MVDEEVRGLSILASDTVSLAAALEPDSFVAIERGGERGLVLVGVVGLEDLLGFGRFGGGWNNDLGEELRRTAGPLDDEAGLSTGVW